jgi:hypothetical protein
MSENAEKTPQEIKTPEKTWKTFLESVAPGKAIGVREMLCWEGGDLRLILPDIKLFCDQEHCDGERFFEHIKGSYWVKKDDWTETFLVYQCKNCETYMKTFAVAISPWTLIKTLSQYSGVAYKFGEMPPFGPPLPPRLLKILGPDTELFLQGYRAEKQSMGIGAFTYYRRVVEQQKNRIFDEIIKVAQATNASPGIIETLTRAKNETQFSKAVQSVKDAIPPALLIDTHNPLTLLHSPLSEGIHDKTDADCLSLATDVRIVLTEIADTIATVLKDKAELKGAVSRLHQFKSSKNQP